MYDELKKIKGNKILCALPDQQETTVKTERFLIFFFPTPSCPQALRNIFNHLYPVISTLLGQSLSMKYNLSKMLEPPVREKNTWSYYLTGWWALKNEGWGSVPLLGHYLPVFSFLFVVFIRLQKCIFFWKQTNKKTNNRI